MRIAAIRGAGLASLAEPFEVDLDDRALRSAGVFAIVGPTGAGKSTLLDAMCLGLFGATPRLRAAGTTRIGDTEDAARTAQDPRGLVRADAEMAFAETDFVGVDGRRYRARWEARRGRKDVRVAMALSDVDSGARLGGGRREVLELVTARLGLDEAQFRRSVLLAQGELTAFLHAEERDRAQLLERVTGTEIYGRISMEAHLRSAEETARLGALEEALVGTRPLEAGARAELDGACARAHADALGAELALRDAEAELRWHQVGAVLEAEALGAGRELDVARRQLALAEAERLEVETYRALAPLLTLLRAVDRAALAEQGATRRTKEARAAAVAFDVRARELGEEAEKDRAALAAAREGDEHASRAFVEAVRTRRVAASEDARAARDRARAAEEDAARAGVEVGAAERELATVDAAIRDADTARSDQAGAPAVVVLALRGALIAGEPCSVCGSRDHPGGPELAHPERRSERALAAATVALARAQSARATRPLRLVNVQAATERQAAAALALKAAALDLARSEAEAARASAALRDAQAARQAAEAAVLERRAAERRLADAEPAVTGARLATAAAAARADASDAERLRATEALERARAELRTALGPTDEARARQILAREAATVSALETELRALDDERRRLEAVLEERRRRLALHRGEPSVGSADDAASGEGRSGRASSPAARRTESEGEATAEVLERTTTLESARARRAALEESRARDDAQGLERARRSAELAEQAERTRVWRALAATIGSADGKKLRVHAQRLTLQALVEAATDELATLGPRFALEVAPGGSLAIQVVDRELGGEPRSVSSLSGGETFVVALALALALAALASRRVSLGTLFIDEGFGSLDPQSLDVVLSSLEALESRGRQIGLVSHVPDVRERFGARVEVRPVGAGKSRVFVVG